MRKSFKNIEHQFGANFMTLVMKSKSNCPNNTFPKISSDVPHDFPQIPDKLVLYNCKYISLSGTWDG